MFSLLLISDGEFGDNGQLVSLAESAHLGKSNILSLAILCADIKGNVVNVMRLFLASEALLFCLRTAIEFDNFPIMFSWSGGKGAARAYIFFYVFDSVFNAVFYCCRKY